MEIRTFPGIEDSLEPIRGYVQNVALNAGLDKKAVYKLLLGVDEISTNIILYGYESSGIQGNVDVICDIQDKKLIITLEDSAGPFDPLQKDLPTKEELDLPLDERNIGGLGIFLTINGVDEFKYEHENNRNRNIFIMNIP